MTAQTSNLGGVDPARLAKLAQKAGRDYAAARPKTRKALRDHAGDWLNGVPMHWMRDWPQPFPMIVAHAQDATITDLDGHHIDDFCLGDTGAMFGHSPPAVTRAIRAQARQGLATMLPTPDALAVGQALSHRFGRMRWQVATTATDANRFALRVARAVTGKPKVLVFNGCYHGTVDEAMVCLDDTGHTAARPGLVGQAADLTETAVVVEFNDIEAVRVALAQGDIAALLTEPVMTNSCMVLPDAGFHDGLRKLTREHDALLIIDETHSQSSGLGGYARVHSLSPDILVIGKCIAGGMPAAVWGMTPALAERFAAYDAARPAGHSGMGTTLSANPMQMACLRATLDKVATRKAFARMETGAARLESGLAAAITRHKAPWHVVRVGARVEFICWPDRLKNGAEAARAHAPQVEAVVHAMLLNRRCLIAPFHNMMLVSPVTSTAQIDRLIAAFDAVLAALFKDK
ncbi:aspartate aminotransferase family protein [Paracoccus sp. p4-l81]|uniref:aspartate aminotransferase family protein n=1 Tax=Paracoccus sp. p4-l81 TaxID=3342806 RepID=UPI0035B7D2DB